MPSEPTEKLHNDTLEFLKKIEELSDCRRDSLDFQIVCSELTIMGLELAEEIERTELSPADAITWHEIASAAKQTAYHALELQSAENSDLMSEHILYIKTHSHYIQKTVPLPEEPEPETNRIPDPIPPLIPLYYPRDAMEEFTLTVWNGEDMLSRLRREIRELRDTLISLTIEKDNLEKVEKPRLAAEYMVKLGSLLEELYTLENELRYRKRRAVLMQEEIKRNQKADEEKVNGRVKMEYAAYRKKYEEYTKRRKAAEDYCYQQTEKAKKRAEREKRRREEAEKGAGGSSSREDRSSPDYMKKLYRKIVRALHPDLHPEQSDYEKDLFKKANAAFEDGDLETLEKIYAMIGGGEKPEDEEKKTIEALIREKQQLLNMIREIRLEIKRILESFPFTEKELLNDREKLEKKRREVQARIDATRDQIDEYSRWYDDLVRNNGQ